MEAFGSWQDREVVAIKEVFEEVVAIQKGWGWLYLRAGEVGL